MADAVIYDALATSVREQRASSVRVFKVGAEWAAANGIGATWRLPKVTEPKSSPRRRRR